MASFFSVNSEFFGPEAVLELDVDDDFIVWIGSGKRNERYPAVFEKLQLRRLHQAFRLNLV